MNKLAAVLLWPTFSFCLNAQITLGPDVSPFAVLAGAGVTNTGPTAIIGDLGVSPSGTVTGFPAGVVSGTIHLADGVAAQAEVELTTAYNAAAALPCAVNLSGQDLGGHTLTPGVYCFSTSAELTGPLTLDAQGNANAQFIFQIGSTLTTASASTVILVNSAQASNIFWQVGSSATLGTGGTFFGTIMALQSITITTGVSVTQGRALARNGAVTLDSDIVTLPATTNPGQTPSPTPAPSSLILLSIGLLCIGFYQAVIKRPRARRS